MGEVKRAHVKDEIAFNKSLKHPLNQISNILPKSYTKEDLLNEFERLFPFQWKMIIDRQQTYKEKAKHLYRVKKIKGRYNTKSPEAYFYSIPKVKNIISRGRIQKYNDNYDEEDIARKRKELEEKRNKANGKVRVKIEKMCKNTQRVDAQYLNIYMNAYHTKGRTIEEKLEIVAELKKFDTKNVIRFFKKLNDSERNNQIRRIAFLHLQQLGYYVKLRKNFKGKNKNYHIEIASLDNKRPEDLYNELKKQSIQTKKTYDIFISHSSKDKSIVQETIAGLNTQKKVCYCDWTMDNDYLKREFVSDYTKQVLKIRMEQSNVLFFLRTENSIKSQWVKFELDYFKSLNKPIYMINYIDDEYKEYPLSNQYIISGK